MPRPIPIIVGTIAALLLLFGAYMGAYYAMLTINERYVSMGVDARRLPIYRIDHKIVDAALYPANELDRLIRPGYWSDK